MKKILCFLLCLMFVIPSAVSLSEDKDSAAISTVSLTITPPVAGTTAATPPAIKVPSGANYKIEKIAPIMPALAWLAENETELDPGTVFEFGKTYYALVQLHAINGHEFTDSVNVNLTNATLNFSSVNPNNRTQMVAVLAVKAVKGEIVSLSKLKSVKVKALSAKKLQVTWKKLSKKDQKKIQKIQIQYSTDKSFKTYKTKWAKKTKNTYTIQGLKKNTKYYIRIRAYKKVGNTVYVSKWVTKSKKTKKQ